MVGWTEAASPAPCRGELLNQSAALCAEAQQSGIRGARR